MFDKIIEKINNAEKIAIFNHEHPDGDALGSSYALKLALEAMGKKTEVFLRDKDEKAREYKLLKGTEKTEISIEECDLKIALDCADFKRIGDIKEKFTGNTIAIDHHATHIEFADTTVVVPDAPATGEIVFDLIKELGVELTQDIANNLYLAITCDTGSFKYSSTTPKTHMVAAELLKTNIDFANISKVVFDTKSFEYLKAYKKGIEKVELYTQGRVAVLAFTNEEFLALGVDETGADGIVDLVRCIEGVEIGVYVRQRDENSYKVSLRSNTDIDVSKIAMQFGGGGHMKASGCLLEMPLDMVKKEIVKAIEKALA